MCRTARVRRHLRRAWFSVWRTEIDLTIVRWFAHRFGWHTNACRAFEACRPDMAARYRANGWWSNPLVAPSPTSAEDNQ